MAPENWRARLAAGNCLWEWHDECVSELRQIEEWDHWGHGKLMSMVKASERGVGLVLDAEKERCETPIPRAPRHYDDPVWLGELCRTGGKVYRKRVRPTWELRIFYAIPIAHPRVVVGVAAFAKRTDDTKAGKKEEQRIRAAMDRAKWWFGQNRYELAPL
ncbi:hypothetical protein [Dietzia kunjamensis]|uniref:hypothetical protein n=1 Tax=Dietzia kunjamensis TaxID=322509 RepID=UPI0033688E48